MPEWLKDFILGPTYMLGNAIWNLVMSLVSGVMTTTPQGFSDSAWSYVESTINPWAKGIGVALLNLFFLISFFRVASNLRENITWELLIMNLFKLVLANGLMTASMSIIKKFFVMAAELSGQVQSGSLPSISITDVDMGSYLFFVVAGIFYVLVAVICAFIILFTVYGRYLKLYLLSAVAPIALSTMAGGPGLSQSAYAWIKSFLAGAFEIVVIAIIMAISSKMMSGIDFGKASDTIWKWGDGFLQALQNVFTMVIMTGSIKGADMWLRRTFAL